ncbi:MAG TPA: YcaO-like family protein [Salinarimonas sp.]|nr:YcaO-like family protein [Salinarimonas sp.]
MTTRLLQGLPADLPDAALAYLEALPPGRVVAFPMTPLDRTGVPAWKAALFLEDPRFPGAMPSGYGYGATDGEAIVGALAEIAEMIGPTWALVDRPRILGSYDALLRERGAGAVADPLTLCLPAGSPVGRDTPLAWTEGFRVATGEPVLIPLDVAACDWFELPAGYRPFTTLITNGLGAGPDLDWAIAHGLLECLQRDGNGLLFRALDQGVVLDLAGDLEPATRDLLARLDRLGIEVMPKFATDEFGLANLYVVGFDRAADQPRTPIMLSGCGEACDPDRDRALRKALLEFCSARVRKAYGHGPLDGALAVAPPGYVEDFVGTALASLEGEESRALAAMTDWARMDGPVLRRHLSGSVFSRRATKSFADLPKTPLDDTRARGRFARERLGAAGIDVLAIDCSLPGVGVAKVVAPGLEVETMSYHRIGERNARKLMERDHPLIRFGETTDALRPVRLTPEAMERLGGQPLFDTALADRIVGPLYPLYREPEAHHVAYRLGQVPAQRRSA